jgi:hypothetical protein
MCKKITPKQKTHINSLVQAFEKEARRCLILRDSEDIELKEPKQVKKTLAKKVIDNEVEIENHTRNVLTAAFMGDKLKILKRRLNNCEDEIEKEDLQNEIYYWENFNG